MRNYGQQGKENRMIVVKIGGSRGVNLENVVKDITRIWKGGEKMVVVHGGSGLANELGERLGHPPEFVESLSGYTSRRTDKKTLEIFTMACAGGVNKKLVALLIREGVNPVGISGMDAMTWKGRRKGAIKVIKGGKRMVLRDDYTGKVEEVNSPFITSLLDMGLVPVISPPAISHEGEPINVDADRASAVTASALGAEVLIILSNVAGLMAKFPDESSLVNNIKFKDIEKYIGLADGRMKKKVLAAKEAIQAGVGKVVLSDGRKENPVSRALLGEGTVIER